MIITNHWVYHHLPKTGGTTLDALVAASNESILWRDSQNDDHKHCHPSERSLEEQLLLKGRTYAVGFRRLPFWLISNYEHKRRRMGLDLEHRPVQQGQFFRQKSCEWLPADWWLDSLGVDDTWKVVRCEFLLADLINIMRAKRHVSLWERLRLAQIGEKNRNTYPRDLGRWFSREQLREAYARNPRWADLEAIHYGGLMEA